MENKLITFVRDVNEILYEKDPIFEEMMLEYSTNGDIDLIEFNGAQLWMSDAHSDWAGLLEEIYSLSKAYTELHEAIREFFRGKLNREIEEKYGLGIDKDKSDIITPLSERNEPMV